LTLAGQYCGYNVMVLPSFLIARTNMSAKVKCWWGFSAAVFGFGAPHPSLCYQAVPEKISVRHA
jgi:hypothetical protein